MGTHPIEIKVTAGTVDHQEVGVLSSPVNDQIINNPGLLIEHQGVLPP